MREVTSVEYGLLCAQGEGFVSRAAGDSFSFLMFRATGIGMSRWMSIAKEFWRVMGMR